LALAATTQPSSPANTGPDPRAPTSRITRITWLALLAITLVACRPRPAPPGAVATQCTTPARVLTGAVEETGRGYPYHYNLFLPPCYQADGPRYPALYLIPGRGGGPGDWWAAGLADSLGALMQEGSLPPLLIVTGETTDSDGHGAVIVNDLIPYIEARYPIQADRDHRAVAGSSLGGVTAYRLALSRPELFAAAGLFGSGLISGEEAQVAEWLTALDGEARPRFFLSSGEQDPLMLERAGVMVALLQGAGLEATLVSGEGDHSYRYWITHFPAFVRWLAHDW
jgi:enterochelin esterase family protein